MIYLYRIQGRVFRARSEALHWNLETSVELNHQTALRKNDRDNHDYVLSDVETVPRGTVHLPRDENSYDVNIFVALKPELRYLRS